MDARKKSYKGDEAWQVIKGAKMVYVASGKKILEFIPATADKESMLKKIIGPSGNLRAPTLRQEDVFFVGYNAELYEKIL
ncbi:MAG: hypothetical protein VR65_09575 [Desulfobulbaceae bacterium BRH_c16a]|nr:MAG: hypothetical protein VR65_09575 [Desulfobulbaceae bacterium BRH_c16a]